MIAKAVAKYVRISPRKARQVADLVRGKHVDEALSILKFAPKKASVPVAKVIHSAAANAEHNFDMVRDSLIVALIYVDQGPTLKRFSPRAYGRGNMIRRRTSHITVVLEAKQA